MPVHKNTTCALQTGYKPTCLCIKTQHVHFKKTINPRACAQNTHPKASIKSQNILKPTCLCTENNQKVPDSHEEFSTISALAMRIHFPHAPAQLRLARTHERIEIEIEIDFPVRGVGQAGLAPPNLR